jgi:hypothetical protein
MTKISRAAVVVMAVAVAVGLLSFSSDGVVVVKRRDGLYRGSLEAL